MATTPTVPPNEEIASDSGFARLLSLDPDMVRCPYGAYADLRTGQPVVWSVRLNAYVVSRYEDIHEALKDPGTFSSRKASGSSSVTSLAQYVMNNPKFPDDVRQQAARASG